MIADDVFGDESEPRLLASHFDRAFVNGVYGTFNENI